MSKIVVSGSVVEFVQTDDADIVLDVPPDELQTITDGATHFTIGRDPSREVITASVPDVPAYDLVRDGDQITLMADYATRLSTTQAAADLEIDAQAESARATFLTPGAGQALEYQATADEAAKATLASDPLNGADYPMLDAELRAQLAAYAPQIEAGTMVAPTMRDIVNQIVGQQGTQTEWTAVGAEIKRRRREAKLRNSLTTTIPQVEAIVAGLTWPKPQ